MCNDADDELAWEKQKYKLLGMYQIWQMLLINLFNLEKPLSILGSLRWLVWRLFAACPDVKFIIKLQLALFYRIIKNMLPLGTYYSN